MTDPLAILNERFRAATTAALGPAAKKDLDPAIRRSDRADFQANGAMTLAKALERNPRDLAAAILAALQLDDLCAKVEIAGPGFINIWMRDDALTRLLVEAGEREDAFLERSAAPEKVVIDYSSPNVAKEMHVGHLRSTIIGDSLARILEARGHTVIRQNHLGDWGTPFGMLIEHLVDLGLEDAELLIDDLDAFYRAARAKFDADPAFADRSRRRVVLLQGGEAGTLVLWRKLVEQSRRYFGEAYERLGITLRDSDVAGESLYNDMLPDVIAELEKKRLVVESEGALCVFPPGFASKDGDPMPLIVRKQAAVTVMRRRISRESATERGRSARGACSMSLARRRASI
jgi:arginyl-tRNA synthetase